MSETTPDPLTPLAAEAAMHHEAFKAWVKAGFTQEQAMELLKAVITAHVRGGQDG
ncbi:MAG TPA: hypothetical protein VFH77_17430 [Streptomyces sp.]|nr:hypothetical protein [Streptomyces sp.]